MMPLKDFRRDVLEFLTPKEPTVAGYRGALWAAFLHQTVWFDRSVCTTISSSGSPGGAKWYVRFFFAVCTL
jgi:hypothetical protein